MDYRNIQKYLTCLDFDKKKKKQLYKILNNLTYAIYENNCLAGGTYFENKAWTCLVD